MGPDELAMWGDFGERTVILWADTEQHIKVRIIEFDMLTVYFKDDTWCTCLLLSLSNFYLVFARICRAKILKSTITKEVEIILIILGSRANGKKFASSLLHGGIIC